MKKSTSKLAILAFALLAAGCVNEINEPAPSGNSVTLDFWAACESPASRVQLDTPSGGSAKVLWENGDAINFVTSTNSTPQAFTVSGLDAPADMVHISLEGNENDSWLYGVYGVNTSIEECSQESITLSGLAPSQQHYTNFFEAHASVAYAQKDASSGLFPDEVDFYNLVGIVTFKMDFSDFSFDMSDVHHVVFSSNDAPICSDGNVSVSFNSSGEPVIEPDDACGTSITITPVAGEDEYFVAVLPATINGFQIKFFDSDNNRLAKISTDKTLTVGRSKIVNLGDLAQLSAPILQKDDYINLSAEETSNCYITGLGDYKFKATVRGCTGNALSDTPVHAQVLWEANSTGKETVSVSFGYIVKDVSFEDDYVYFTTNRVGSALIAVYNEDYSKCLWSWHIWVWPDYYNNANPLVTFSEKTKNALSLGAVYLMDRNLGADSDYPAAGAKSDIRSWGFVYQWGRKDPFQPRKRYYAGSQPANVLSTSVASNASESIQYAIEHPTTYIYSTASSKDWIVGTQNNNLWGTTKTEYDPCPPGWKVPGERVFENAFGSTKNQTVVPPDDYIGFNLHNWIGVDSRDQMIYYPVPGYLEGTTDQTYVNSSTVSHYWTTGTSGTYAYVMSTRYLSQQISPKGTISRHRGVHVRCMLDRELPPVRVTGVSLDHSSLSLSINQSVTLKASVIPANSSNTAVTWKSSDATKVYVDTNGKVTGLASTKVNGVDHPCTVTVTTDDGKFTATCQVSVAPSDIRDLSEDGETANCYIVYEAGKYSFPVTVKGNSNESVGSVASLEILWQTTMSSSYSSGNSPIIPSVVLVDGTCQFEIINFIDGNAVIAAKSSNGTILWSWHIWACAGYNPSNSAYQQVYNNNAGTVMDRNLGALSATANDAKTLGLYYQWGRKDPFTGPATIATTYTGVSTYPSPWAKVACSSSYGTVDYAVKHPTTFITKNTDGDWMYSENTGLWSSSTKTMYDPCPPGWRVPKGGTSGLWATASGQTQSFVSGPNAYGHVISDILAPGAVWYPFTGVKGASDGVFTNLAQYGFYWSANHMKTGYAYSFNLYSGSAKKCLTAANYQKAGAVPVRCVMM